MNNSFLSIIENDELHLSVHAERRILSVYSQMHLYWKYRRGNYRYKTVMKRNDVAIVITKRIMGIDYYNFKDTVKDYDIYSEVWERTLKLQK